MSTRYPILPYTASTICTRSAESSVAAKAAVKIHHGTGNSVSFNTLVQYYPRACQEDDCNDQAHQSIWQRITHKTQEYVVGIITLTTGIGQFDDRLHRIALVLGCLLMQVQLTDICRCPPDLQPSTQLPGR